MGSFTPPFVALSLIDSPGLREGERGFLVKVYYPNTLVNVTLLPTRGQLLIRVFNSYFFRLQELVFDLKSQQSVPPKTSVLQPKGLDPASSVVTRQNPANAPLLHPVNPQVSFGPTIAHLSPLIVRDIVGARTRAVPWKGLR
jgi:hypothetical protein